MTDVSGASLPSVVFIGTVCIVFYNCTNKDYRLLFHGFVLYVIIIIIIIVIIISIVDE